MADHTDNALRASIKALEEVVLPALDTADPLAREQLRLVTNFLKFLRTRLPYRDERHRFELRHFLNLGRELANDALATSPEISARLQVAIKTADALLDRQSASFEAMETATAALSGAISALVRFVAGSDPAVRQRVERLVFAASKSLLDAQRAWFLPMGFELDKDSVPPLDVALRKFDDT